MKVSVALFQLREALIALEGEDTGITIVLSPRNYAAFRYGIDKEIGGWFKEDEQRSPKCTVFGITVKEQGY